MRSILFRLGINSDEIFKEKKMSFRISIVLIIKLPPNQQAIPPLLILFSLNKCPIRTWEQFLSEQWTLKAIIFKLNYRNNNYNCFEHQVRPIMRIKWDLSSTTSLLFYHLSEKRKSISLQSAFLYSLWMFCYKRIKT